MNIKLALAALICSVAMSCSVSEGQLLDRMLSKVGCTVCENANARLACDTGCDTGCGGVVMSGGCGAVDSCGGVSGPGILDRIKNRLSQVGCGGGCEAAVEPCGCAAPVVESCGCDAAPSCGGGGLGLLDRLKGRLSAMGSGCGCEAPAPIIAEPCGCDVAPSCGCDAAPSCGGPGILDKIKARFSSIGGCGAPADDCGCNVAPVVLAPAPMPCAAPVSPCDAAPSCGGGLLDRLKGRLSSVGSGGGCGCAAAPVVSDCGCSAPAPAPCTAPVVAPCAAPVADCGCNAGGGRVRGAISGVMTRVRPSAGCGCDVAPVSDCGCNAGGGRVRGAISGVMSRVRPSASGCGCNAAPVASCGCDAAPVSDCGCSGTSRGRLSLLDRLRGNRIPRDRSGRAIGAGCNDGCNSPCPNTGSDCGCAAPVATGCSSCGGSVMAAPMAGEVIYSDASAGQGVIMETPAAAPAATEAVIEEAPVAPAVDETPAVDPNAFIIRKGNIRS